MNASTFLSGFGDLDLEQRRIVTEMLIEQGLIPGRRERYMIFVDGGALRAILKEKMCVPQYQPVHIEELRDSLSRSPKLIGHECVGTVIFDALPFAGSVNHFIRGFKTIKDESARKMQNVLDRLSEMPGVRVETGRVIAHGWRIPQHLISKRFQEADARGETTATFRSDEVIPHFAQKGVDIRFAQELAHICANRVVEKVVLVTTDSDFAPALQAARREGVEVHVASLFGMSLNKALTQNSDHVIDVTALNQWNFKETPEPQAAYATTIVPMEAAPSPEPEQAGTGATETQAPPAQEPAVPTVSVDEADAMTRRLASEVLDTYRGSKKTPSFVELLMMGLDDKTRNGFEDLLGALQTSVSALKKLTGGKGKDLARRICDSITVAHAAIQAEQA